MCYLWHILRIFLFRRKVMFHSWDIHFFCIFNHPMIYKIFDVMMGISIWAWVHFWIYLLNENKLSHQTLAIDRHKQGQYSSWNFWIIWRTGAKSWVLFNLPTGSKYSTANYIKIPVLVLEKVNKGQLKMVNINY